LGFLKAQMFCEAGMVKVVQLRLIAETQADAQAAIAALRDAIGSARVALSSPAQGRKGGWLAYGTLQIEAEVPAATGSTERLAATGKTTRLKR
jgi:hypothetical protein